MMGAFVSVCVYFVLNCDMHVQVSLSSCGVFYFWQEVVGGKVCVCVIVCMCVCLPFPDETPTECSF